MEVLCTQAGDRRALSWPNVMGWITGLEGIELLLFTFQSGPVPNTRTYPLFDPQPSILRV